MQLGANVKEYSVSVQAISVFRHKCNAVSQARTRHLIRLSAAATWIMALYEYDI